MTEIFIILAIILAINFGHVLAVTIQYQWRRWRCRLRGHGRVHPVIYAHNDLKEDDGSTFVEYIGFYCESCRESGVYDEIKERGCREYNDIGLVCNNANF